MKLTVLVRDGKVPTDKLEAMLVPPGCSIGCHEENVLVLPDDRGAVAGRHAVLTWRDENWHIRPEESAVLALNGRRLEDGREETIRLGDLVEIGSYTLKAIPDVSPWEMAEKTGEPPATPAWDDSLLAWAGHVETPAPSARAARKESEPPADPRDCPITPEADHRNQSSGLEDLVNLPVDPLSLFGESTSRRMDPATSPLQELFSAAAEDDPIGPAARKPTATPWNGGEDFYSRPIQDHLPAQEGHLKMKIAEPDPAAEKPAPAAEATIPPVTSASTIPSEELAGLAASFLDGAGVSSAAGTGEYTPQLMHALGRLVGQLRACIYANEREPSELS